MALFKFKSQCPKCVEKGGDKSKDNLANYSDGGKHCFSCGYHVHGDENYVPNEEEEVLDDIKEMSNESKERIKQGTTHKLTWRGIRPETNKFFGVVYECSQETGLPIKQFVPTTIDNAHVGYKTRLFPKDFSHPVGEVGSKCDLIGSFRFVNGGKYVVLCAGECFTGDTEIMTEFGFVKFSDLSKEVKVLQVLPSGNADFTYPLAYIEKEYDGDFVLLNNPKFSLEATANHNFAYLDHKGEMYKRKATEDVPQTSSVLLSTQTDGQGTGLSEDQIALTLAICADSKLDTQKSGRVKAHLSFMKARKIERLIGILSRLGVEYTSYVNTYASGKTYTTFNLALPDYISDKRIPVSWVSTATAKEKDFILDELRWWDGNECKLYTEFTSKHKSECDTVQALCVTNNRYSVVRERSNKLGTWYVTSIHKKSFLGSMQKPSLTKEVVNFKGKVYCVAVPSGYIQIRNKGKVAVVGNCDFLSAFQMLRDYQISRGSDEKYDPIACVTPTVGEGGCGKQIQGNYKFLDKFERIVVCFDNDAAGKAAVEKITPLLPRGKVYIMTPRYKDANEYLTKGKEREFVTDFYNAKKHTPAGIVASTEIYKEVVQRSLLERLPFPPFLEKLNKMLSGGITYGFIVNILAGSGSGKSSLINQCVIHWAKECNILTSVVSLEADSAAYGENLLSCYAGKKLALISNKEEKHSVVTSEYMENCAKELFSYEDGSPRMYILDDRGDYSELQSHVEELITSFGVKVIVFDVISDVFAGMSIEEVDKYMRWQKNIVKQYNCILINISHTRKSGGGQKAASQGAFLTEEATIGSGTQYRSAGINISLQRDKTAEDDVERNTTQVYLLKSRDTGVTGLACEIFYENETHTLYDKEYYFSQVKPPSF